METKIVNKKSRLGTGLDSLLGPSTRGLEVLSLDVEKIHPDKNQPRKHFKKDSLEELAQSIKNNGVLQPILVKSQGEAYQIIAGERRWRASLIAGLHKIPAIIKNPQQNQTAVWALLENIQRENLNPIEMAEAFKNILSEQNITQEDLSKIVALPRSSVANTLRLLQLDSKVQEYIKQGKISFSQARELLKAKSVKEQRHLAEQCVSKSLSVKSLSSKIGKKNTTTNFAPNWLSASLKQIEKKLSSKIKVQFSRQGRGKIALQFRSEKELKMLLDRLWGNK